MARVRMVAGKVLVLLAVSAVCLADDDDLVTIPPRLGNVWEQLNDYFCSGSQADGSGECLENSQVQLCNLQRPEQCCSIDRTHDDIQICESNSQMFVCQFIDAVVCEGELDFCVYHRNRMKDAPFCVCTSGNQIMSHGRCTRESSATTYLVVASCVAVFIIVLLVFLICWVWRRGTHCCRKDPRSTSTLEERKVAAVEGASRDYEQALPYPAEYSYAYGHVKRSPASDPCMVVHSPDLDEQQADHYYSRLTSRGDNDDGAADHTNTGPETGPTLEDIPARPGQGEGSAPDPPAGHAAIGPAGLKGGDETRSSGYEVARGASDVRPAAAPDGRSPDAAPRSADSGYEVARGHDAKPVDTGYEVARGHDAKPVDTGYEVATVPPPGDGKPPHRPASFALEPKDTGTGYEEVTKADVAKAEDVCQSPGYDRLKRPVLEIKNDDAVMFNNRP